MSSIGLLPTPTQALLNKKSNGQPINVLTIDGGALRGIVPATLLAFLDGTFGNIQSFKGSVISSAGISLDSGKPPVPVTTGTKSLFESFDLIVGTSAGGLLTAGMSVPQLNGNVLTAADLVNLFYNEGEEIFPMSTNPPSPLLASQAIFDNTGLAQVMCGVDDGQQSSNVAAWGAPSWLNIPSLPSNTKLYTSSCATLNDAKTSIMITSFNNRPTPNGTPTANQIDNNTPWGPIFVNNDTTVAQPSNETSNLSVAQACLMTSAFPLLLPPVPWDLKFLQYGTQASTTTNRSYFLDGGVWAGNPALATYMWLVSNGFQIGTMVSLGCGDAPNVYEASNKIPGPEYETAAAFGSGLLWATGVVPKTKPGWMVSAKNSYSAALNGSKPGEVSYTADDSILMELLGSGAADWSQQFLQLAIASQNPSGQFFRFNPTLSTGLPAYCSSQEDALQSWIKSAASSLVTTDENGNQSLSSEWQSVIKALNPAS